MSADAEQIHATVETPLGSFIAVIHSAGARAGLHALASADDLAPLPVGSSGQAVEDHLVTMVRTQVDEYFSGSRHEFSVPMAPAGNSFEQRVWAMVCQIPYGARASYGEIAEELGNRGLARQVARAMSRCPISIIVPCHRVVRSDGSLSGSARGVAIRQALLDLESRLAT